jgi:pSer/pThr/pTyr-binding forkhead associated (FHA) protein
VHLEEWREWTTSTLDFPRWFITGCYAGLACCIGAIAAVLLYSTLRRRGTTQQVILALLLCVLSIFFIAGALGWFYLRFLPHHFHLAHLEIEAMMAYVLFFGLLLPLAIACRHFFAAVPRPLASTESAFPAHSASPPPAFPLAQNQPSSDNLPLYQPGVQTPFVFNEETPWGWLEYRGGNFQGQRLALKRSVVTIGRDEACDIWLDDDLASRLHAELVWDVEGTFFTDCNSMNGSTINEQPVQGTVPIRSDDVIGIGIHRFAFLLIAPKKDQSLEQEDPLALHTWRSVQDLPDNSQLERRKTRFDESPAPNGLPSIQEESSAPTIGALCLHDAARQSARFLLHQPITLVGRNPSCKIVLDDPSIAPQHAYFLRQEGRDYLQDLTNGAATRVNRTFPQPLQPLQPGDQITLGNVHLTYELVPASPQEHDTVSTSIASSSNRMHTPTPLKLPSRPRFN